MYILHLIIYCSENYILVKRFLLQFYVNLSRHIDSERSDLSFYRTSTVRIQSIWKINPTQSFLLQILRVARIKGRFLSYWNFPKFGSSDINENISKQFHRMATHVGWYLCNYSVNVKLSEVKNSPLCVILGQQVVIPMVEVEVSVKALSLGQR